MTKIDGDSDMKQSLYPVAIFAPDGKLIPATVCYSRTRARRAIATALCCKWHDAWMKGYRCRRSDTY